MSRSKSIRKAFDWTQAQLAAFLGVTQATVFRFDAGQGEPGPVAALLDLLEAGVAAGVVSPGMSPDAARAALRPLPAVATETVAP